MRLLQNPAANHQDKAIRNAFAVLFGGQSEGKFFGRKFLVRPYVDKNGKHVLLFRTRNPDGWWKTAMAIDEDGNVHVASIMAAADFTALGWNPAE